MAETYKNKGQSTLSAAIGAADTSLTVVDGSQFPATGNFRIIIDSELILVGARSGNTLSSLTRGVESTTAASHASGATATHILTAAALTNIVVEQAAGSILSGTDASKPAAATAGRLYFPNDGFQVYRDSGTVWVPWGSVFPFTAPINGDFAWVNQGTASVDTSKGGIYLAAPATAGLANLRLRTKAVPAAPYTVTIGFIPQAYPGDFQSMGLVLRNSVGGGVVIIRLVHNGTAGFVVHVSKYTNPTTFSADYVATLRWRAATVLFMQFQDDNTNRISRLSNDGQNFVQVHSVARTDFITPDEVGFGVDVNNNVGPANMTLLHWKQ